MIKTVNISLEDSDLKLIDDWCMAHSLPRSKFFVQVALDKVNAEKLANAILNLSICASNLALKGDLTESERAMLVSIDNLMKRGRYNV